jgi:hypothetical protein
MSASFSSSSLSGTSFFVSALFQANEVHSANSHSWLAAVVVLLLSWIVLQ